MKKKSARWKRRKQNISLLNSQRTLCSWSVVHYEFYQMLSYSITGFYGPYFFFLILLPKMLHSGVVFLLIAKTYALLLFKSNPIFQISSWTMFSKFWRSFLFSLISTVLFCYKHRLDLYFNVPFSFPFSIDPFKMDAEANETKFCNNW